MFGFLKKQLKKGVEKLSKKVEEPEKPVEKAVAEKPVEKPIAEKHVEKPVAEKPVPMPAPPKAAETSAAPEAALPPEEKPAAEPGAMPKRPAEERLTEEKPAEGAREEKAKTGLLSRLRGRVVEKTLDAGDIDGFFSESETELLQNNVALEVSEFLREELKKKLAGRPLRRSEAGREITAAFESGILEVVDQGDVGLERRIAEAKEEKRPFTIVFLGFNGSGKTTSMAKTARWLMDRGYSVVLAAGDTFRAASIEQLEVHAKALGVHAVKHKYGADSAAVIFDARKHAESRGIDVVLADTAGRMHTDKNLMDELRKLIRVNKPDLKVLVVDSITGNDAVEQAREFDSAVGVDAVLMTKVDVNEKGGSILSVCYAIKKPVLFMGTGQGYADIRLFNPREFVKGLME